MIKENILHQVDKKVKDIRYFLHDKYELASKSGDFYGKSSELATSVTLYFGDKKNKHNLVNTAKITLFYKNYFDLIDEKEVLNEIPQIELGDIEELTNINLIRYNNDIEVIFSEEEINQILSILGYSNNNIENIKKELYRKIEMEYDMNLEFFKEADNIKISETQRKKEIEEQYKEELTKYFIWEKIIEDIYYLKIDSLNTLNLDFLEQVIIKRKNIIEKLLSFFKNKKLGNFNLKLELISIENKELLKIHLEIYSYVFGPYRNHNFDYKFDDNMELEINTFFENVFKEIKNEWDFEIEELIE